MAIDTRGGGLSTLRPRPTTASIRHDRPVLIMGADGSIVPDLHVGRLGCPSVTATAFYPSALKTVQIARRATSSRSEATREAMGSGLGGSFARP